MVVSCCSVAVLQFVFTGMISPNYTFIFIYLYYKYINIKISFRVLVYQISNCNTATLQRRLTANLGK